MVKLPEPTTFDTELPSTMPSSALVITATLAGPPEAQPASQLPRSMKSLPTPVISMNAAKSRNMNTNVAETPSGMPNTPSVVNQRWFTSCEILMF